MNNGKYYVKVFFGAAIAFALLDHAAGTNAIASTIGTQVIGLQKAAQGR